ncbi:MAG: helix-turn-helix domain-containing protein [Microbacteriaceae bacterium]|nr:helix-turn-helix domain-containing protein [Microbacteriaceae bacterium]
MEHDADASVAVAAARLRAGLSLRELARRSGVSVATLSRIESGEQDPTWGVLARIAEATGAPIVIGRHADTEAPPLREVLDAAGAEDAAQTVRRLAWVIGQARRLTPAERTAWLNRDPAIDDAHWAALAAGAIAHAFPDETPDWVKRTPPADRRWAPIDSGDRAEEVWARTPEPLRRRNVALTAGALETR